MKVQIAEQQMLLYCILLPAQESCDLTGSQKRNTIKKKRMPLCSGDSKQVLKRKYEKHERKEIY